MKFHKILDVTPDASGAYQIEAMLSVDGEPERAFIALKGLKAPPSHEQVVNAIQAYIHSHFVREEHAAREAAREDLSSPLAEVIPFKPPFWTRLRNRVRLFFARLRRR